MITHDLGVVAEVAQQVAVMYAGQVVEQGSVEAIFADPQHPYTIGLMGSIPSLGTQGQLSTIPGTVPLPESMPQGCRFATRCPFAQSRCHDENRSSPRSARAIRSPASACRSNTTLPRRDRMTTPILEARDLSKLFPGPKTLFPGPVCHGGRSRFACRDAGRNAGDCRRVRFREIHPADCYCVCWPPAKDACFIRGGDYPRHRRPSEPAPARAADYFQDPFASLNPRMTVEQIVGEPLWLHQNMKKADRQYRVAELLKTVGLPAAWPGAIRTKFSGGQRQRIGIARALASGQSCCWATSRFPRWMCRCRRRWLICWRA